MYPGTSKPLKRGKACLTCRFLKIKCDGVRPICGPCERHPKDDPCEYADGPGRSRTKQLEDTVSRLEARLREYENPHETPAVTLSDPYDAAAPQDNESTLPVRLPAQPTTRYPSEVHSYSPASSYSTISPIASSSSTPISSTPTSARTSSASPSDNDLPIRHLLDAFFPQASSFGFFLHVSSFYNAALQPSSFGFPTRPCSSLLSTVLLWGLHLSSPSNRSPTRSEYTPHNTPPPQQIQEREHTFLIRALRETAIELVSMSQQTPSEHHRSLVLQTIQAEVLLSYYFFRTANIAEARRHASSAASLVLSSGLHHAWSSSTASRPTSTHGGHHHPHHPHPAALEEGERINGFWTVFTLYRNLAVAMDSSSEVCGVFDAPGMQVDTPWPLDMESYKEGVLPVPGSSTIWNYLNHVQTRNDSTYSTHALLAKASILLHQATFLEGQFSPDMTARDSQAFSAAFQSLSHLIDTFRVQLPPLSSSGGPAVASSSGSGGSGSADPTNPTTRLLFLVHSMVNGAIIKLRGLFAYSDPSSRQMCVNAAKEMIMAGGINVQQFLCVNPIMGTLWMLASQILTEELTRLRSISSSSSTYPPSSQQQTSSVSTSVGSGSAEEESQQQQQEIYSLLQLVLGAMSYFSTNSAMMSKCLLVIRRWIFDEPTTTAVYATTASGCPTTTTTAAASTTSKSGTRSNDGIIFGQTSSSSSFGPKYYYSDSDVQQQGYPSQAFYEGGDEGDRGSPETTSSANSSPSLSSQTSDDQEMQYEDTKHHHHYDDHHHHRHRHGQHDYSEYHHYSHPSGLVGYPVQDWN
ncbi:hypothetical protein K435DRAFT_779167 [Dendrothele bispora CBS 962.96]|uniref:Zn(2)-C6 fungal-type domain-containing protein n=1 Tax=Dendrothele bispora (strain CBS 962.96) TaxID=1314807 RepID=A0A4S8LZ76_DENBC|nr:hypothetical protein K435DRAFT_779167 [Dendrothele bispora CBS 962.96]